MKFFFYSIAFLWALAGSPHTVSAQAKDLFNKVFSNKENELIYQALDSTFLVVRVEYVLTNAQGDEYGTVETDYFGFVHHLGCLTLGGILLPATAISPWVGDKGYAPIDSLKPKLYKIYYRLNSERKYTELTPFQLDSLDENYVLVKGAQDLPQIPLWETEIPKEGWMLSLLVKYPNAATQDTMEYKTNLLQQSFGASLPLSGQKPFARIGKTPPEATVFGRILFGNRISLGTIHLFPIGLVRKEGTEWGAFLPSAPVSQQKDVQPKTPTKKSSVPKLNAPTEPSDGKLLQEPEKTGKKIKKSSRI